MSRDKHRKMVAAAVLTALLLLVVAILARHEIVGENVWALGLSLGGLSRENAIRAVFQRIEEIEHSPITLVAGDASVEVEPSELRLAVDESHLADEVQSYLATRSLFVPATHYTRGEKTVLQAMTEPESSELPVILERIAAELSFEPVDSHYAFVGRDLVAEPPRPGQTVSSEAVLAALKNAQGTKVQVEYVVKEDPDAVALPTLALTGEYSTFFDPSDSDRNVNLELAGEAVHGEILLPGQVYSFNKDTGMRTREKGYKDAFVVVGNRLVPGLAGGICQVTTTLFNAAARAGLGFPEVHAHGIPVSYVDPGYDAAVEWGYLDLKIKNDTEEPVVFGCWVEDGEVAVRVFGVGSDREYSLESKIIAEYPSPGMNPGLLVETWRVVKKADQEISRELVVRSYYQASYPRPEK